MKNGRFFILFSVALVLLSLGTVQAASSNDFVKLDVDEKEVYTHKDLVDSRYLVASDEFFYGSNEGQITMKLYFRDKIASGNYKIGLRTESKNITVKSIGIGKTPSPVLSVASTSYVYPNLIPLNINATEVIIIIEFDPIEIGVLEEFDVILYNDKDEILVIYDPFISGFDFRQKLTLNTDGIGLGGDITNDHSILVYLDPTNTDFWTGDTLGTGNGITFAQSDEVTEYDFDIEDFNNADNNAWFWVEMTETFTSGSDLEAWLYYGGTDVNNSDGTGAYPANYKLVYHVNETSGTNLADATGTDDVTLNSAGAFTRFGKIAGTVNYEGTNYGSGATGSTPTDFSMTGWVNVEQTANSDTVYGVGTVADTLNRRETAPCADQWAFRADTALCGSDSVVYDTWQHVAITFVDSSNTKVIYTNAQDIATEVDAGLTQVSTFYVSRKAGFTTENMNGRIDEMKLFTSVLSADEVLLLFNSEDLNLITFGAQELPFLADFSVSLNPNGLDPENNITTVVGTLTDASTTGSGVTITDWNYFIDTVQFFHSTVNGNTTRNFTTVGDFNISLIITGSDGNFSQRDRNVSISQLVQNMDINFSRNTFTTANANLNFGVTFTGSANAFNWGFPSDENQTIQNINKTFTDDGTKTVCITIANSSDANKTACENFLLGRVLTRIPQDAETFANLTTFSITARDLPIQSYSGLSADSNVYFFDDATSYNASISIDFNSDYFPTARTFVFNSSFFDFQPYLVADDGTNLEATIFTINNAQGRVTISGIRIESFTDVNGTNTLVESKFSDGTGQALFHFIKGQEYRLDFYDSDSVLLTSQTIEANDTQYFAFLEVVVVDPAPTPQFKVGVNWDPLLGNIVPRSDGNVTFSPIIVPVNGTVIDINVFISHVTDSNIVYEQVFNLNSSADFNLTFDLNVAGFNDNFPLNVNLQVLDSGGVQIGNIFSKSYSIKGDSFEIATERTKDALGQFGVTLLSLAIVTMLIGQLTKRAVGEDTNFVVIPAMFLTGVFVFIGWIEFDVWTSGVMFSIGLALWGTKK